MAKNYISVPQTHQFSTGAFRKGMSSSCTLHMATDAAEEEIRGAPSNPLYLYSAIHVNALKLGNHWSKQTCLQVDKLM